MDTIKYIIKVVVEDEFGLRTNYYSSSSTYFINLPYLSSQIHSERSCVIDESLFTEESFWKPVKHFINNFDANKHIDIDNFKEFLSGVEYDFDEEKQFNIEIKNWFNDYDLTHISWDGVRLSFYYNNSSVSWIDIIFYNGKLEIIVHPRKGSLMYGITETDWCDFVTYLKGGVDIAQNREIIIDDILSDKIIDSTLDQNLIRRLKFNALFLKENRFLESVYDYYLKYGKLSPKQIESISKIII